MKIILKADVQDLGRSGDVVDVKKGYARNYLLPTRRAVPATPGYLKDMAKRIEAARVREERERLDARSLGERLQALTIKIHHRAAEGSTRLHGSVTANDISDAIKEAIGLELDRRTIDLRQPIRSLGDYQVNVKLVKGVTVPIRFQVVDPVQEAEAAAAAAVAPAPAAEVAAPVAEVAEEPAEAPEPVAEAAEPAEAPEPVAEAAEEPAEAPEPVAEAAEEPAEAPVEEADAPAEPGEGEAD